MGLFRRGTQLLRLGSGLRDCCCRPENPKECFCPDLCRYYWDWGGDDYVPAGTLFRNCIQCFSNSENIQSSLSVQAPYGLLSGNIVASGGVTSGEQNVVAAGKFIPIVKFSYSMQIRGDATGHESIRPDRPFFDPIAIYSTSIFIDAGPLCPKLPAETASWYVFAALNQAITIGSRAAFNSEKTDRINILSNQNSLEFTVPAVCIKNSKFWCCPPLPQFERAGLHLNGPLELQITGSGVTANGVSYPWIEYFSNFDRNIAQKNVEGDFPFDRTVVATILSRDSCRSGDCDCEADLTGRTVVFKGKTFTYGSGDEFTSDDGSEFWEESPAGVFRKVTFDACDVSQLFIALQETAEIICSETIEEGQFWAVFFTVECRERDACGGAFDRSRTTIFNGIFTCDSEGFPSGTPTVELASDELSDPAPTGDCAAFPSAPSINFT